MIDNPFLGIAFRSLAVMTTLWLAPFAAFGAPMMWRP